MNLALFYVWENARVWAHGNLCFDMHLSCLGPVSHSFPSWVPSGCTVVGGYSVWGVGSGQPVCLHPEFPQGAPSGVVVVANGLMAIASFVCWYGKQHFFHPQCLPLVITSTNVWEAFHDQFYPITLGSLIPRSGKDSVDNATHGSNFWICPCSFKILWITCLTSLLWSGNVFPCCSFPHLELHYYNYSM